MLSIGGPARAVASSSHVQPVSIQTPFLSTAVTLKAIIKQELDHMLYESNNGGTSHNALTPAGKNITYCTVIVQHSASNIHIVKH